MHLIIDALLQLRMDDDYVNISTEDTPHDGGDSTVAFGGSGLQQNDTTTQEFATTTATSSCNERVDGSMSPCIEEQDVAYNTNNTNNNMNVDGEDDRKPAAKSNSSSNNSSNTTSKSHSKSNSNKQKVDNRFTCAICLENVSDEPVVTKCGHLYCWSCLYQWLEPGMLLSEYNNAFGGGGGSNYNVGGRGGLGSSYNVGMGIRNNSIGSSNSSSGGLNFLSTSYQTTTNIQQQQATFNDRPYNPSGGQFSQRKFEQRRHCPVCKASCTVDSVIPIYLTGLESGGSVNGDDSSMLGSVPSVNVGDTAGHEDHTAGYEEDTRRQSVDSLDSLDVDNNIPTVSAAQSSLFANSTTIATTPEGSPSNTPATDTLLAMELEDPTNSNLGLRQRRRRGTKRSSPSTTTTWDDNAILKQPPEQLKQPPEQEKYECKSPTRTSDTSGILDSEYIRQQDNANNNTLASHDNTPIHRNSIDFVDGINNDTGMEDTSGRSASNVPSRPMPNYPMQPQNTPMSQPDLVNDHTTLNESISPNMTQSALSSPFRLALRPRHPSLSSGGGAQQRPATHAQRHGQTYSQTYAHSHHRHHGRLTSALLGIVDTIDNLANNSTSSGAGVGQASTPAASVVPTLHRSDGGMGGIGRASEVHQNGQMDGDPTMMMSEEESSLANAREFLSRLLLMLACFVVLCLLLF